MAWNHQVLGQLHLNAEQIKLIVPRQMHKIFKKLILNDNFCEHILCIFCEIALGWIHVSAQSQHWFRQWLGAVRQQAIIWVIIDHMVSIGFNDLIYWISTRRVYSNLLMTQCIIQYYMNMLYYNENTGCRIVQIRFWFHKRHSEPQHHRPDMEYRKICNL